MNRPEFIQKIKDQCNLNVWRQKMRRATVAFKNFSILISEKIGAIILGVYARYIKTACTICKNLLYRSANYLFQQSQSGATWIREQWKKHDITEQYLIQPTIKFKNIFIAKKEVMTEKYQKSHDFVQHHVQKKEVYQSQVKKILIDIKISIIKIVHAVLEKSKDLLQSTLQKIHQHEKASRFFNLVYIKTEKIFAPVKQWITKKLKILQQYEWYQQLKEASDYDAIKITLLSSFFINLLALAFPFSLMQVYDRIIPNQAYTTLIVLFIGITIAILLEAILRIARSYINLWVDAKYEYALSKKAFRNLLHVPLYVYENTDIGTRIKQFSVLDQMRGFYNNQLLVSICDTPFLIIFLLAIYYIGGWLVLVPLIVGVTLLKTSSKQLDMWRFSLEKKLTHESRENDFLVNVLTNIHTAKSLGMENLLIRRYERMQNTTLDINYESTVQAGDLSTMRSAASQFAIIFVAALGAISSVQDGITIGSLLACILLVGRFMMPLVNCITAFNRWKMINIIRHQLEAILQMPVTAAAGALEIQGDITLKNVGYLSKSSDSNYWVFKDINLQIPPRMVVSIIGESQGAKEKLLNIFAAIARPTAGEYLIDGKNVDQFQNYLLRSKITYLSKAGSLFQGTIMDNLSGFNPNLIHVAERFAQKLGLDAVLSKLPAGYDTLVGNKAVESLPNSVINLIYIIRSLVNKPKIILFDEADMDLDVRATTKMIQLLTILKEIATIIILPTSKETMEFSDVIYELKQGELQKVAADGNPSRT